MVSEWTLTCDRYNTGASCNIRRILGCKAYHPSFDICHLEYDILPGKLTDSRCFEQGDQQLGLEYRRRDESVGACRNVAMECPEIRSTRIVLFRRPEVDFNLLRRW